MYRKIGRVQIKQSPKRPLSQMVNPQGKRKRRGSNRCSRLGIEHLAAETKSNGYLSFQRQRLPERLKAL